MESPAPGPPAARNRIPSIDAVRETGDCVRVVFRVFTACKLAIGVIQFRHNRPKVLSFGKRLERFFDNLSSALVFSSLQPFLDQPFNFWRKCRHHLLLEYTLTG